MSKWTKKKCNVIKDYIQLRLESWIKSLFFYNTFLKKKINIKDESFKFIDAKQSKSDIRVIPGSTCCINF